jgi:hypothetical protein
MAGQRGAAGLSTADFNIAEQFVLWALRTRLEGAAKRDRLEEGFRLARDDAAGGVALGAFESWFETLATNCWRDLHLHRAPCSCLSGDEWAVLDLVASAQAVTTHVCVGPRRYWSTRGSSHCWRRPAGSSPPRCAGSACTCPGTASGPGAAPRSRFTDGLSWAAHRFRRPRSCSSEPASRPAIVRA